MRNFAVSLVLWYLRFFAKGQLFKFRPTIIGVGGASGKTSLCNFISIVLSQKFKVLGTKGKNSETGIPLSILKLDVSDYTVLEWLRALILAPFKVLLDWEKFDIFVAEMGIDGPFEPKNMEYLLKIVRPRIGVLTNISYEHSVYFEAISKKRDEILKLTAKQEGLLLENLPKNGFAVVNFDDPIIRNLRIKSSKVSVSSSKNADFFISKIEESLKEFKLKFFYRSNIYNLRIKHPLPKHYAYSLVMAIAVCKILNIEIKDSIKILETNFLLPAGRLSVFEGKKNTTIIDSSYNNATLSPIIDILEFLNKASGKKRKVAILGDMRELGVLSKDLHKIVARKVLKTTDLVFLIGPLMKKFVAPILLKNKHKFYSFNTFSEGKVAIEKNIKTNDIVLVKSSQNTLFLERAIEMLLKNPKDREKLTRRGKFWDKIRSQTQ